MFYTCSLEATESKLFLVGQFPGLRKERRGPQITAINSRAFARRSFLVPHLSPKVEKSDAF
jgi:hypothetical protein